MVRYCVGTIVILKTCKQLRLIIHHTNSISFKLVSGTATNPSASQSKFLRVAAEAGVVHQLGFGARLLRDGLRGSPVVELRWSLNSSSDEMLNRLVVLPDGVGRLFAV